MASSRMVRQVVDFPCTLPFRTVPSQEAALICACKFRGCRVFSPVLIVWAFRDYGLLRRIGCELYSRTIAGCDDSRLRQPVDGIAPSMGKSATLKGGFTDEAF